MSGMYGADVAELRALAQAFERAAESLGGARQRIGSGIRIAAWIGPFAVRFRSMWDNAHSRQVDAAARSLREAAEALRRNADDQDATSRVDGAGSRGRANGVQGRGTQQGGAGGGGLFDSILDGGADPGVVGTIVDFLGVVNDLGGLKKFAGVIKGAGTVILPFSMISSGVDSARSLADGDAIGFLLSAGSGVVGGVGGVGAIVGANAAPILARLGPVGLGVAALKGLVDVSLPYNAEKQDQMSAEGARVLFGAKVDVNALSEEQLAKLKNRYTGGLGVGNMISDTMTASGADPEKSFESASGVFSTRSPMVRRLWETESRMSQAPSRTRRTESGGGGMESPAIEYTQIELTMVELLSLLDFAEVSNPVVRRILGSTDLSASEDGQGVLAVAQALLAARFRGAESATEESRYAKVLAVMIQTLSAADRTLQLSIKGTSNKNVIAFGTPDLVVEIELQLDPEGSVLVAMASPSHYASSLIARHITVDSSLDLSLVVDEPDRPRTVLVFADGILANQDNEFLSVREANIRPSTFTEGLTNFFHSVLAPAHTA